MRELTCKRARERGHHRGEEAANGSKTNRCLSKGWELLQGSFFLVATC
jgi:hypothetical protein